MSPWRYDRKAVPERFRQMFYRIHRKTFTELRKNRNTASIIVNMLIAAVQSSDPGCEW